MPEAAKTKELSQWLYRNADEPSPVTFDPKRKLLKTPIDTVVEWANNASEHAESARAIFQVARGSLHDMESEYKKTVLPAAREVEYLERRIQHLSSVDDKLNFIGPLQTWCQRDVAPEGAVAGKITFCNSLSPYMDSGKRNYKDLLNSTLMQSLSTHALGSSILE